MKTYLSQDEVEQLLSACDNQRDYLLIAILWVTGMRVGELISLHPVDLDTESNILTIIHEKSRGSKPEAKKFRQIPVRPDIVGYLAKYIAVLNIEPDQRIFPICRQSIYSVIQSIAKKAGLGGRILTHPESNRKHYISPHKFRDALAVHWLGKKSNLEGQKALQSMLGHQSFATTARYFKLGMKEVKGVYAKIWS